MFSDIFAFENLEIILPALIAGIMISLTHAPLGVKVLEKNIIFIDLAIAQIAGLGLVLIELFLPHLNMIIKQLLLLCGALLACSFFYYIEKTAADKQEAVIGCSFILAASLTILLLTDQPMGMEAMKHILSGQILFITWFDIAKHFIIYLVILFLWFRKPQIRDNIGFYILFACAITSSVQLVGIYVVFASLILPALAVSKNHNSIFYSYLCGLLAMCLGMVAALIFDLPAGGVIVVSYILVAYIIYKINYIKVTGEII
jgi:zinc/manganese transport system permease protein